MELEAEVSPFEEDSLIGEESLTDDWSLESDEGEEGSAPVRRRWERAV